MTEEGQRRRPRNPSACDGAARRRSRNATAAYRQEMPGNGAPPRLTSRRAHAKPMAASQRTSGRQLCKRPVWPGRGAGPTSGLPQASDHGRAAIARTRRPRGTDTRACLHACEAGPVGFAACFISSATASACQAGAGLQHCRLAAERKGEAVKVRSASHFSPPPLVSLASSDSSASISLPPKPTVPPRSRPVRFVDRVLLECRIGASRCLLCCWCAARPLLLVALDALRFCLRAFFSLSIWMHFSGVSRLFDRAACSGRSNPCFACCCLVMVWWYFFLLEEEADERR